MFIQYWNAWINLRYVRKVLFLDESSRVKLYFDDSSEKHLSYDNFEYEKEKERFIFLMFANVPTTQKD